MKTRSCIFGVGFAFVVLAGFAVSAAADDYRVAAGNSDVTRIVDDGPALRKKPTICTMQYAPVCGKKNGSTRTYSNSCFARADGAKVIAAGPCK
ncbi:MAG: hypothetical protein ACREFC_09575 [Stellaceae bacterium]